MTGKENFIAKNKFNRGFSLVESLLSIALFALIVSTMVGVVIYGQESMQLAGKTSKAVFLAEEGLEAARNIRDNSFSNLSNGVYGLAISSNKWTFSGTSDITEDFTRTITISTPNTNRFLVSSTVTWPETIQRTGSVSLATYLNNWRKITIGDWTNPNSLVGSYNASGTNAGIKIQVQGSYAYLIRSGGTPNFLVLNISNPSLPTLAGSLSLTNTLGDIAVSGNYAYVTSTSNSGELNIIDISNPASPSLAGTYNAPGNTDGLGVYASGTTVYLGRASGTNNEFCILNVSVPSSPALLGSVDLAGSGNDIALVGNYAYVAGTNKLQVINVSNPASPSVVGTLAITGTAKVAAFGTEVVLGAASNLITVDVFTPSAPVQQGSYAAGGAVNDISLGNDNNYAFIGTSNGARELQVISISTPLSPSLVGFFNASGIYNGLAYDSASDRVYAATSITTAELNVIAP